MSLDTMTSTVSEIKPEAARVQSPGSDGLQNSRLQTSNVPTTKETNTDAEIEGIQGGNVLGKNGESQWRRVYKILTWTPPNCRWDPNRPPQFSMSMNALFAFAAGCKSLAFFSSPCMHSLSRCLSPCLEGDLGLMSNLQSR